MNAKDIAKALKCCYAPEGNGSCEGCPYDGAEGLCYRLNIEYHAGETIESLLALLDAAIAGQETLQKALVESQRRERAVVEMLSGIESCLICMPGGAGCNAYGSQSCYRVRRGPKEGEPHETL